MSATEVEAVGKASKRFFDQPFTCDCVATGTAFAKERIQMSMTLVGVPVAGAASNLFWPVLKSHSFSKPNGRKSQSKKGVLTMKSLIPWRNKKTELANRQDQLVPFGDFEFSLSRIRDEFDRFFDRMARDFSAIAEGNGEGWRWGMDVVDEDDKVIVKAEAPGFEAGDFDLRVEDNQLVLRASKQVEKKDDKGNVQEYREQECYEAVTLPAGIDADKVDADYHNGVLTVTLPKTEESKAKRITVKAS